MFKWLDKKLRGDAAEAPEAARSSDAGASASARPDDPPTVPNPAAPSAPATRPAAPGKKPEAPPPPVPTDLMAPKRPEAGTPLEGAVTRDVLLDRTLHPVAYEIGLDFAAQSLQKLNLAMADAAMQRQRLLFSLIRRFGADKLVNFRELWISVCPADLVAPDLQPMLAELPAERVVLRLTLSDPPTPDEQVALAHWRAQGMRLALADYADLPAQQALLPLCHFVEMDTSQRTPIDLGEWPPALQARYPKLELVATAIESMEELEFCQRVRFHRFRGPFLTKRELWPRQPKMSPERTRLIQLLNRMTNGAEVGEIGDLLRASPELSYRLLRYINSPGVGLVSRVASVQQALVLLGRDKLYRWLTLLLFSAGGGHPSDNALLEQALVRARMMETLGSRKFGRAQADELFVVGIFSLIDVLLRQPMSVALEPLQLPNAVHAALVMEAGEYAPYLALAIACEEGRSEPLLQRAGELGLSADEVAETHLQALVFAQELLAG